MEKGYWGHKQARGDREETLLCITLCGETPPPDCYACDECMRDYLSQVDTGYDQWMKERRERNIGQHFVWPTWV